MQNFYNVTVVTMASDPDKSRENSPSNHPMVLRSSCHLCCAAELSSQYTVSDRVSHRRNVYKTNVNGSTLNFHGHYHHNHFEESAVENYILQSTDCDVFQTAVNKSGSSKQGTATSENGGFKLFSSLQRSLVAEQGNELDVIAGTRKLVSSSSANNCSSSTSMYKESYSDYSSGNESTDLHSGGEVNISAFREDMSRTRAHSRIPLSSSRFGSHPESENEESTDLSFMHLARHDENARARSVHLLNNTADDYRWHKDLYSAKSGKEMQKDMTSRSSHLHSVVGSANDMVRPSEAVGDAAQSFTSHLSPYTYSGSIFAVLRWMFWRGIYLSFCEVLLFDTWVLSRCNTYGKKKSLLILLLLLLPLWLLGAFLHESYSNDVSHSLHGLKSAESWSSVFNHLWFARNQQYDSVGVCSDELKTTQSRSPDMWKFFFAEEENSVKPVVPPAADATDLGTSISSTEMSDEKIRLLALEVFKKASDELMEQFEKRSRGGQEHAGQADMKIVHRQINTIASQYQSLSDSMQVLKSEVQEQLKSDKDESLRSSSQLLLLNAKLQDLEEKLASFENLLASAKNCCNNESHYVLVETHLTSLLMKVMEGHEDDDNPILSAFQKWLRTSFISRKNLSDEVVSIINHMYGNSLKLSQENYEDIARRVAESVISKSVNSLKQDIVNISKITSSSVPVDHYKIQGAFRVDDIQKIIKEAILLYDADKTGRVDYALESGGGSIISTRCSETYSAGTARLSIFGLPLWYTSKSPRTAIQPEVQPGECWAFYGSQGFLVIQLSATIQPTGFSMEHIPKSLSPTGTIDSAPKDFSVWGLTSEKNSEGMLLGKFTYNSDGDPLQYFPVVNPIDDYYSIIELKIHSNWGNQKYTCLYRFRVHGSPL